MDELFKQESLAKRHKPAGDSSSGVGKRGLGRPRCDAPSLGNTLRSYGIGVASSDGSVSNNSAPPPAVECRDGAAKPKCGRPRRDAVPPALQAAAFVAVPAPAPDPAQVVGSSSDDEDEIAQEFPNIARSRALADMHAWSELNGTFLDPSLLPRLSACVLQFKGSAPTAALQEEFRLIRCDAQGCAWRALHMLNITVVRAWPDDKFLKHGCAHVERWLALHADASCAQVHTQHRDLLQLLCARAEAQTAKEKLVRTILRLQEAFPAHCEMLSAVGDVLHFVDESPDATTDSYQQLGELLASKERAITQLTALTSPSDD